MLLKLLMMAQERMWDEFYENAEMVAFVAEMLPTYFLCGVRNATAIRNKLGDGSEVFEHFPPGPMAFACLTLLNNHDLWTERCANKQNDSHASHKKKGGLYTSACAGGGGAARLFTVGGTRKGGRRMRSWCFSSQG